MTQEDKSCFFFTKIVQETVAVHSLNLCSTVTESLDTAISEFLKRHIVKESP